MLQKRTLTLFMLALLFGGLAAYIAYQRSAKTAAVGTDTRLVVVAAFDIEYGTKIEGNMIKQVPWPANALPEGVLMAPTDAIGKVVNQSIGKGEPVTARRAVESLGGSSLASLIAPGKRAMTVRVNDVIGVAGFLLPGNRVDVLGTPTARGQEAPDTTTLVENLKVLAVDQQARAQKDDPVIVRAVTVEVTPQEAETIVQATNAGAVQLVLRNPLDEAATSTPEATPEPETAPVVALRPTGPSRVLAAPKPPETVTVIRGVVPEKVPVRF